MGQLLGDPRADTATSIGVTIPKARRFAFISRTGGTIASTSITEHPIASVNVHSRDLDPRPLLDSDHSSISDLVVAIPGRPTARFSGLVNGHVNDLMTSEQAGIVAIATTGDLIGWDVKTYRVRWRHRLPGHVADSEKRASGFGRVAFAPSGRVLAASASTSIALFDPTTGRLTATLGANLLLPTSIVFTPSDLVVASGSHVTTWSLDTGERRDDRAITIPHLEAIGFAGGSMISARSRARNTDDTSLPCNAKPKNPIDGLEPPGAHNVLYIEGWGGVRPPPELADEDPKDPRRFTKTWPPVGTPLRYCQGKKDLADFDLAHGRWLQIGHDDTGAQRPAVFDGANYAFWALQDAPHTAYYRFSPDGAYVLGYWWSSGGLVFETATGERVGAFPGGSPPGLGHAQNHIAMSNDREHVAVGAGAALRVYSRAKGTLQFQIDTRSDVAAVAPNSSGGFLVGGADGSLAHVRNDAVVWRNRGGEAAIVAIQLEPSGRRAATISDDGGVRVWDLRTGSLLLTFLEFDDDEWIAVTPDGHYNGTAEAADRLGWVFGTPSEYFRFEQFSASFRDPKAVADRVAGRSPGQPTPMHRPPRVELRGEPKSKVTDTHILLPLHVESSTRVDRAIVFANARPVAEAKICSQRQDLSIDVPLGGGENLLAVVAFDDRGYASNPIALDVAAAAANARRPELWIVAIGVDRYPHLESKWQLAASVADAGAVAKAFAAGTGPGQPFAKAHAITLFDDQVTVASVRAALDGLSQMQPDDAAIVFLAGHGWKAQATSNMVFVTGEVANTTTLAGAIGWEEIASRLARARGRVIVLLDACHAGHVSQELVVPNGTLAAGLQKRGRAGVFVFAAAKGRQLSYETQGARALARTPAATRSFSTPGNHGIFTGQLLEALKDPATDRNGDGAIQLGELVDTVTLRVVETSEGLQTPWVARRELFGDFNVVRAAH